MSVRPKSPPGPRILVVTAVEAEAAPILRTLDLAVMAGHVVVHAGGVGVAAAAVSTAALLASSPFGLVVSAGVAGGFLGRAPVGATVLGTRSIAADLGAQSPEGFLSVDELGFGTATLPASAAAVDALRRARPGAIVGDVLTVATVTGTAERAAELADRYPAAVAEAMEGFGVASAAARWGTPYAEIRTISNAVGPRDRGAWRLTDALDALADAVGPLASLVL